MNLEKPLKEKTPHELYLGPTLGEILHFQLRQNNTS